jgi:hypothetical protein
VLETVGNGNGLAVVVDGATDWKTSSSGGSTAVSNGEVIGRSVDQKEEPEPTFEEPKSGQARVEKEFDD